MSKTIEDAAREYYYNEVVNGDSTDNLAGWSDCFKAGAQHVLSLPLSERLTDDENARIRKAYEAMSNYGKNKGVECADCANYAARVWMGCIFGKEMFNE